MKPVIFALAGGGAALVVAAVSVFAVMLLNKPLPTSQTASGFMLTYKDVSPFNLQDDSKPMDQVTNSFIYGDCSAKTDLKDATGVGTSLGKKGFTVSQDNTDFWISSQLLQFPTEDDAKAVLVVMKDGATDSACDSTDILDYYSGGEALSSTYGVNVDGVSLVDDWNNDTSNVITKSVLAVARRGTVLLYVQTHNVDSSGVSASDVSTMITLALKKFNG